MRGSHVRKMIVICIGILLSFYICGQELESSQWLIKSAIKINCVIGDYSEPELSQKIGKIISYSETSIIFDENAYQIKNKEKELWTREKLYAETRGSQSKGIAFEDIGFYGEQILAIQYKAKGYKWPGEFILMLDSNNAVTIWNGVWYLLERINYK